MQDQESGKVRINWIEYFKVIQRVTMVVLTLLMLWAMQYVGSEIAEMRKELTSANKQIGSLVSQIDEKGGQMSKVIDNLEKRLGRSWFF